MNKIKKNIFGKPIPYDSCSAPLLDYGDVENESDTECSEGYNFENCPNLEFYENGKWKGHSKCIIK